MEPEVKHSSANSMSITSVVPAPPTQKPPKPAPPESVLKGPKPKVAQ